ncbi:MAG: tRNA pseudouridine(55) synthase TruB [bacterium]|nr:tRNA pseudouridine(55) synthase TruB [bacterium]MDE0601975.1 tRNA pseudouridine(55) synthase TruB [bacterium]
MAEGFLVLDKPGGITSHDVVAAVRRAVGIRRVGHAGTLDPMATGALVVAVGRVTRLIRFLQPLEKEYLAVARFGVATDTLDADGVEVWSGEMPVSRMDLEAVLGDFVGEISQVPPMVSAVKVEGRRLYEIAREGRAVERKARRVTVHSLDVTGFEEGSNPLVGLRVVCGKGVYVRSLADDLARALGGRAHLVELRRTRVGSLAVGERAGAAPGPDDLENWERWMLPPAEGLADLPAWTADPPTLEMVRHGRRLSADNALQLEEGRPTRVLDASGRLWAVYTRIGPQLIPEVVLN